MALLVKIIILLVKILTLLVQMIILLGRIIIWGHRLGGGHDEGDEDREDGGHVHVALTLLVKIIITSQDNNLLVKIITLLVKI